MIQEPLSEAPASQAPMTRQERLIICCVSLAAFTFQFEAFVINVALPSMAIELHASSTEISFAVLSYLLATTITLVPAGKLGDRFGLRRTFLSGCALATIGTLFSGLSTELYMLLVCRFLQGLGIGTIVANAYAMVPLWISKQHAGRSYGLLSMGAGVGMVAGLPVGGVLSYALSWHWVFLSTTPIFLGLLWLGWKVLPREQPNLNPHPKLDWIGLVTFGLMLSCAVLTVSLGGELGWSSTPIVFLFLFILMLVAVLVARKNTKPSLFSPEILSISGLIPGLSVLFIYALAVGGVRFLLPFYLQLSCGLTAWVSSILLLAYPLSFAPTGAWAGNQADRIGSRKMVTGACLLVALLCGVFAWEFEQLGIWFFILFLLGFGFANGMFFAPNNRMCMLNVPHVLKGEVSALLPVAINMGTLIGVSVFESVFSFHIPDGEMLIRDYTHPSETVLDFINHGLTDAFGLAALMMLSAAVLALLTYQSIPKGSNNQ